MAQTTKCRMKRTLAWGGDIQTGEAEVEWTFTVLWGAPEQGPSYASGGQPADPDEINDIRIISVDGKPWPVDMSCGFQTAAQDHQMLEDKILDDFEEAMLEEAADQAAYEYEQAMESRRRP